jgi:hypothetical protein
VNGRERRARTTAALALGTTVLGVILYAYGGAPAMLGLALGGAAATVAGSVWFLYERGKRVTALVEELRRIQEKRRDGQRDR